MRTETPRTYAPATCGFLPLHLYEGPELERASEIVAGINSLAMAAMGFCDGTTKAIESLSLREMLDAVGIVERYNQKPVPLGTTHCSYMVPDDRLTAAAYTLIHFKRHWGDDESEPIVVLKDPAQFRYQRVHALIIGSADQVVVQEEAA